MRSELELARSSDAPALARRWVVDLLAGVLERDELERAKLLTSELVTNAFIHGRGRIAIRARLDDDRLLIEVIDEGTGFERRIREDEFDRVGGRGLDIVDAEASRWGIHEGTTHVWFEVERAGPRLGTQKKPAS